MKRVSDPAGAEPGAVDAPARHRWLPRGREGLRYRLGVAVRALAAIGGGYVLSALAATAFALWLPTSTGEAVLTGTLASFIVFTCAVMWAFAARTALRAWIGLAVPGAVLGMLVLLRYPGGAS